MLKCTCCGRLAEGNIVGFGAQEIIDNFMCALCYCKSKGVSPFKMLNGYVTQEIFKRQDRINPPDDGSE